MDIAKDSDIYKDRILILDFCSQYTQLIARRIRELGVYCEIFFYLNITEILVREFQPSGIILSGSPKSVNQSTIDIICSIAKFIFQYNVPVLGICFGMHIMVISFGGSVNNDVSKREFGRVQLKIIANSMLVSDIYDTVNNEGLPLLNVWMSHSDTVISVPEGFVVIGLTKNNNVAIIANEQKRLYGVQFHPEVTHTVQGRSILERFVLQICSCKSLWKTFNIVNYLINHIKNVIGDGIVLLAFSGGIDSLVTALLLQRAIGNNKLICCFVDSGLLRYNECDDIKKFIRSYSLNVIFVSASNKFFTELIGIVDPEEKRCIIGRVFVNIFEEQRKLLPHDIRWLAQGTIYSDIIESGMVNNLVTNFVIKSHHNVGGFPNTETMKLFEPIKSLFKDEVRKIGEELGISANILYRHPFPGPGLGIRVLGEVKEEYCNLLRKVDNIFIEELQKYNLYTKISQAFAVFLPIRSVGVMGDVRKYEWVIALRAVETTDFMTACWVDLPYDFLCAVSSRIINEVDGISRVVYDISNKPPSTIEWE